MEEQQLPYGWIVKKSKSHPDRVYYFNVNTGESSWEFPDLIKPFQTDHVSAPVSPPVLTARSLSKECGPEFPMLQASAAVYDTTEEAQFSPELSDHDSNTDDSAASPPERKRITYKDANTIGRRKVHRGKEDRRWSDDKRPSNSFGSDGRGSHRRHAQNGSLVHSPSVKSRENIKRTDKQSELLRTGKDRLTGENRHSKHDNLKAKSGDKKIQSSHTDRRKVSYSGKDELAAKKRLQTKCRDTVINNVKVQSNPKCGEVKEKQSRVGTKQISENTELPVSDGSSKFQKVDRSRSKQPSVEANNMSSSSGNKRKVHDTPEPSTKKQRTESVSASNSLPNRSKSHTSDKRKVSEVYPRHSNAEDLRLDKRKVVKTGKIKADSRSVQVKDSTVSLKSRSESLTGTSVFERQTDLTVVTNLDLTTDRSPSPELQRRGSVGSTSSGDRNNNSSKTMVMNMDKLLTVQSWIDNLGEGSDSPRLEFYAKCDDSEANARPVKVMGGCSATSTRNRRQQRGWPGEARPADVSEREIVEMEVEDCELPEYTAGQEEDMDIDVILSEVRHQLVSSNITPETSLARSIVDTAGCITDHPNQALYVVVDTNVLMTNIHFLEDFKDQNVAGFGRPVLYIPWIVLQELDHLKETIKPGQLNLSVVTQHKASKGIRFLKDLFSNQHPRIRGQTPAQAEEATSEFQAQCNDDRILQSCLQCQKLYPNSRVVLLTNDNNLSNKTMVTGVSAFNSKEIVAGLQKLPPLERPPDTEWLDKSCSRNQSVISEPVGSPYTGSVGPAVVTTPTACSSVVSPYKSAISPVIHDGTLRTPDGTLRTPDGALRTPDGTLRTPSSTDRVQHSSQKQFMHMQSVGGDVTQTPQSKGAEHVPKGEVTQTPLCQNARPVSARKCIADKLLNEERNYTVETLVDDLYCKMKVLLKEGFGCVLEVEMQKAYEDIWLDIVLKKPPWSLMDILLCWKKHWMAVFGMVFSRHLSHNVERLIQHFSSPKGHTIRTVLEMSKDSLMLLHECVNRKLYGEPMVKMKECVQCIRNLCDNFDKGTITMEAIPSLDQYLKSKLVPPSGVASGTKPSQSTAKHKQHRNNSVDMQTGPQPELHSTPVQSASHISQSTSKLVTNHIGEPLISPQTSSSDYRQEGSNVAQTATQDFVAGRLLEHIWQFIYKYYDSMYKALTNQPTLNIVEEIKAFLQVLVPATKQLRHHYARVLEIQISELIHHEDMFVSLCNLCNTFFKHINMEVDAPVGQVSANQFLMLYSNVQHRSTLNTFLQQLDDMLIHLVKCVQIVSPDS